MCACTPLLRMFADAQKKSINAREFTESIPEPILERQIGSPGRLPSFSRECCDSQSDCMDQSPTCRIPTTHSPQPPRFSYRGSSTLPGG